MYDRQIRAALAGQLEAAGVRVVHEWAIGGSVLDVAAITDRLHAYEIKGPRDSLARLEHQARDYNRVFDRVTLVGSVHHVDRAQARGLVPEWWGLAVAIPADAHDEAAGLTIVRVREPAQNPAVSPTFVAALLYVRELRAILQRRCLPYRTPGPNAWAFGKGQMIRTLCDRVPLDEFRPDVCAMLHAREHWKADEGRRTTGSDARARGPIAR